ncbi:glycoside hydrolase [Brachionus plicatilis]|uniref:Glycoside hydrolase n=1 Tax=Brachionus plicatilis TaxID=10195 RepID=A0A3M7R993_BRAPC|nr:glycoside hydrolase [Brachionus plicatilis]
MEKVKFLNFDSGPLIKALNAIKFVIFKKINTEELRKNRGKEMYKLVLNCNKLLMRSLIIILAILIDIHTKCIGLCNKENKCHFVSHKSSLCVLYSFYAEHFFQYSSDTFLYEKLDHIKTGLKNFWPIEKSRAMNVVGSKDLFEPINCTFSNDRFGTNASALSFNFGSMKAPSGDYLGGKEFTVLAWVKLRSYLVWQRLFDFGNGQYNKTIHVSLSDQEQRVNFRIREAYSHKEVKSSVLHLNMWYHLGFTLYQGVMSIYIDGNLKDSTNTGNVNLSTEDRKEYCFISKSAFKHDPSGNFECDDIKFFNKALTALEINIKEPNFNANRVLFLKVCLPHYQNYSY